MLSQYQKIDNLVLLMKSQIIQDVMDDLVPENCASFSELHDYVDANEYGNLCQEDCDLCSQNFDNDKVITLINYAQTIIDNWIKEGGIETDLSRVMLSDMDNVMPAYAYF